MGGGIGGVCCSAVGIVDAGGGVGVCFCVCCCVVAGGDAAGYIDCLEGGGGVPYLEVRNRIRKGTMISFRTQYGKV